MEVTIRPLEEKDAYISVKWRNDPDVFKYTGNTYNHEILIENELAWIKKVINNKNEYRCAIVVDGLYVGNVYLTSITEKVAEYQIFLGDKNFWGRGVARKASLLIINYGFNILKLDSIYLNVNKDNARAYNLYVGLGFKEVEEKDGWKKMELLTNNL